MKFTTLFLFLFFMVTMAGGNITLELVDSNVTILVDTSSKTYSPKILEIPFTYEADDYQHPGFRCNISSSLGSVVWRWGTLDQKLLLPTFYAEPGSDSTITISFRVVLEDVWNIDAPPLDQYTVEQTFTVSTVQGAVLDDGLEWVTTGDGLHKNEIWDVKKLPDSTLVFEYGGKSGVALYKKGVQGHWDSSNVFDDTYLNRLQLFKDGLITYDTFDENGYVRYYDGTEWHLTDLNDLPSQIAGRAFVVDTLFNKAWTQYRDGGVGYYDGENWLHFDTTNGFPPIERILFMKPDGKGGLWVQSNDRPTDPMAHFDGSEWKLYEFGDSIGHLYEHNFISDLKGGFYACNSAENNIFHFKSDSLHNITTDLIGAPIDYRGLRIYPDGHGDIWLRYMNSDTTETKLIHSSATPGLVRDTITYEYISNIHDFMPVDTNRFWLRQYKRLSYYDGMTLKQFDASSGLVDATINLCTFRDDKAWVTYKERGGVSHYDGMKWHYFNFLNSFTDYPIMRLFPVSDDEVWATFKDSLGVVKIPGSPNTGIVTKSINTVNSNPVTVLSNSYLLSLAEKKDITISILNVKGQVVYAKDVTLDKGEHRFLYPKGIATGMYLLSVTVGNRAFISKMVNSM